MAPLSVFWGRSFTPSRWMQLWKRQTLIQLTSLFSCVPMDEMEASWTEEVRSREEGDEATCHGIHPRWKRLGKGKGASMA